MHIPVLLEEVVRYLDPQPNEEVIDATVDGGGHARAILQCTAPRGILLGIDRDSEMAREAEQSLRGFGDRVIIVQGNFANIATIAKNHGVLHPSRILFDLGTSSYHLVSGRGFSFQKPEEPLDMRFDTAETRLTAEAILNHTPLEGLIRIFKEYGEYERPKQIAERVVEERKRHKFKIVADLLRIIPRARGRFHPATKLFQALRIAVNQELQHAEQGIREAFRILIPGGRMAVISFHSLEDRITKNFFKEIMPHAAILTKKPVVAGAVEIRTNPRSRSAKLRALMKHS